MVAGFFSLSCCMSLTVSHGSWLSLTVSLVPLSCYMSLTVSHACWLSLTVSPMPCSGCMSLTVSYGCCKLLHVSPVLWSCCITFIVTNGCWLSLTFSQCHGIAACLLLSPIVAVCLTLSLQSHRFCTCLSLSLPVPWSCCMSLSFSHGCWQPLNSMSLGKMLRDSQQCLIHARENSI